VKRAGAKPLVAVVDDDRDFREAVRLMLTPTYHVEGFSSGEGLPGGFEGVEPDLLLLDIHMPGADGFKVCSRIRADPRFKGLPVLFLTSSRTDEDFMKTLRAGGDAYLTKPIGAAELRRRIREALQGSPAPAER
jgi:DNA-binding response OmpR family regulator